MFRVSLDNATAQRTCQPLYEQHQATPYPAFLDAIVTTNNQQIYSGMVVYRTGAETVALLDGATANAKPFGLAALDRNSIIDDTNGLSNVPFAVWIGASDAFFQVTAPAFDTTQTYTVPTNGTRQLLYAGTGTALGKLTTSTSAGAATAVAELFEVVSSTSIIVRLLNPGTTP